MEAFTGQLEQKVPGRRFGFFLGFVYWNCGMAAF